MYLEFRTLGFVLPLSREVRREGRFGEGVWVMQLRVERRMLGLWRQERPGGGVNQPKPFRGPFQEGSRCLSDTRP